MTYQKSFEDFSGNAGKFVRVNAGETALEAVNLTGGGDMVGSNNLSDLTDASAARSNLGVNTAAELFLMMHPIGSIYLSTVSTNPGDIFGGTWSAYAQGKVLVGIDSGDPDFDTAGASVGAKTKAISAHAGTAVANHSNHTHSVTSNVSVDNHSSHTHTYTEVPNHVHVQRGTTTSTGNFSGLVIDASAGGNGGTISDTTTGHSTQNPTGGVATGTTAGPNAPLAHTVNNPAVTSGNESATLTHSVTQPNDHSDLNVVQPGIVAYIFQRTA